MADQFRMLFGDENAERDPLLRTCAVMTTRISASKPILTGRWGTGKTAILLLQNMKLSEALAAIDPTLERLWYLDETTLDLQPLLALRDRFYPAGSNLVAYEAFLRSLQAVWTAEILRVFRRVLGTLWEHYGSPEGKHWDFVREAARNPASYTALWKQLPAVLAALLGNDKAQAAVENLEASVEELFHEQTREKLAQCLRDIRNHPLYPVVAIEPIETPTSALETADHGLAQPLITALLNVYNATFSPDTQNPFSLRISVPWHRFDSNTQDFPQKLFQYRGYVSWSKRDLREFVSKRIAWELSRVRTNPVQWKDAWEALFPDRIENQLCDPHVSESTFDYFLRHSHHRPRDLLRLVRTTVETQAEEDGVEVDEVLKRHTPITVGVIKDNFRKIGREATKEIISEAFRRYAEIGRLELLIKGMAQPFQVEDLAKRIKPSGVPVLQAARVLWEAGLIGATAVPTTPDASRALTSTFSNDARTEFRVGERRLERWSWYEYNWDGTLIDILQKLESIQGLESSGIVFHPKAFEYFGPTHLRLKVPIGI